MAVCLWSYLMFGFAEQYKVSLGISVEHNPVISIAVESWVRLPEGELLFSSSFFFASYHTYLSSCKRYVAEWYTFL